MRQLVVCCETQRHAVPYVEAMRAAGAAAEELLVVTPEEPRDDAVALGRETPGLLLCGGPDMEPWRYGEAPRPDARLALMPELDELEWRLLIGAAETGTPVWAVCRGLQTFNVFRGGTLWQDLPTQVTAALEHHVPEPRSRLSHGLDLGAADHPMSDRLEAGPERVNSRHHQAIRELGRGLHVVARSEDGLVEAAALDDGGWWVRGVQWHPEDLVHMPAQRRLWEDFVATARRRGAR